VSDDAAQRDELQQLADEQAALRRVATLVAAGASESELVTCVTNEVAKLVDADSANMLRWDGDTVRVIGDWFADERESLAGRVYTFGGDTITARVVESGAPARIESADDLRTEFGRARWAELGFEASIAAPIVVDGRLWGVVTASRTTPNNPFPSGAEHRLGDFAALVAQAIANTEARREVTELAAEQAALRRVATLVAGGRKQAEVLEAAAREAGHLLAASAVAYLRWEGVHDEVVVVGGWDDGTETLMQESRYHPASDSATLGVLETGLSTRTSETSRELGERCAVSSPVIVNGRLIGAFTALRPAGEPFPAGAESRLRGFSDLVAQSIVNVRAQEEMRAAAARIVRASDDARERLERNLHDGAQQRLVAVSISMRLALARLPADALDSRALLVSAADELTHAIDELRELARGIHPALLTDRGLGPALEALASRTPLDVAVANELDDERLPLPVEAAAYFVVAESLTNIAKHAEASSVEVRVSRQNGVARVEVTDDGIGGADASRGSGLRGLADRVEALDGRLHVVSPPDAGTRVWAEIPL
jgi:signal transduction histidine kinase